MRPSGCASWCQMGCCSRGGPRFSRGAALHATTASSAEACKARPGRRAPFDVTEVYRAFMADPTRSVLTFRRGFESANDKSPTTTVPLCL